MNVNDFNHQKKYRWFELKTNGTEVFIPESQMSDEVVALTEEILKIYPQKISAIVEYLSLTTTMDDNLKEELFAILQKPRIEMNRDGGRLNYGKNVLNRESLDRCGGEYLATVEEHYLLYILFHEEFIFELMFHGALESFGRVFARDKRCKLKFNAINIRNLPGLYVGSTGTAGVYMLMFSLIEDVIRRSSKENVFIKLNLVESDTCVLVCKMLDSDYWINNTEEYDNTYLWPKVVKALSDTCEVHINNAIYTYRKGALVSHTNIATDHNSDEVKITFRPDKSLFSYEKIEYYMLFYRMKELAQLNGHVSFHLSGEKNENALHFSNGLESMLEENMDSRSFMDSYYNPINIHFIEGDIDASVFMTYSFEADAKLSYVNNIRTYDGGAHVQGLYDGILAAFEKYMRNHMGEDMVLIEKKVSQRLNFVIHIKMDYPPFQGAVKRNLGGEEVYLAVKNGIMKHLYTKLKSDPSFLDASRAVCETDLREILEDG